MSKIILQAENITKSFNSNTNELLILDNINLIIQEATSLSIMGSSGSGKSTLLHILAGLDKANSGKVLINGKDINKLSDNQLSLLRNEYIGFIYQFHHLLSDFTALENTLIPLMIKGKISQDDTDYAKFLLNELGIGSRIQHLPSQLSGGERQRVAIARALINKPLLVFADEPTGNLDNYSAKISLDIFFRLQEKLKTSLVIVTHDYEITKHTKIKYKLHNTKLELLQQDE